MSNTKPTVAVLGGTGDLGGGLAWQLVRHGYNVIIGSRNVEKAKTYAAECSNRANSVAVSGLDNVAAATAADIVIVTVPFSHAKVILESIKDSVQGKILVDTTVPLVPPKVMRVQMPAGGSAALETQALLGDGVRVVSAFQNIAAAHLQDDGSHLDDCDVLVCGNDKEAREVVVQLAQDLGMKAWHAGALANSVAAEALTSVLIFMNKHYQIAGAGIKITGDKG